MAMSHVLISRHNQKIPNINIRVKVLKVETLTTKNFDNGKLFLDLFVSDEEGARIGVIIKNLLKDKYEPIMKLQHNFYLKNAFVINNPFKGSGVHWEHESKMMITPKTIVLNIDSTEWVGHNSFKFIPFTDLANSQMEEEVTADVIGRLQYYSGVKQFRNRDELKSKYINLELKDLEQTDYHDRFGKQQLIDANVQCVSDFRKRILELHATDDSVGSLAPSLKPPTNSLLEWYKVCVRVEDVTEDISGTATLTLFKSIVSKYVTKSAYVLQKSLSEDQDQPDELDKLLDNTLLFKLEVTKYSLKAIHPTYTIKDATSEPAFVEKFLEEFKKEQGKQYKFKSSQTTVSQELSRATNCGSTVTPDVEESINLSNNTSYTPPKK
ncbi:uncharacterized protein [Rutidosis leptorrhynchoides]|uniref:uncharacterized protein n=1 Tax=Rutidosis leptorrhynchoides TaxID=125765 RepID=UPI003A997E39